MMKVTHIAVALIAATATNSAIVAQAETRQNATDGMRTNVISNTAAKPAPQSRYFDVNEIEGSTGISVPVKISLPQKLPKGAAFVTFDGFPEGLEFSAGKRLAGSWLVRISDIADLTVRSAANKPELFLMEVTLTADNSAPLETRLIRVDLREQPAPEPAKSTFASLISDLWQTRQPVVSRLGGNIETMGKTQDRPETARKHTQENTPKTPKGTDQTTANTTSVTVRDVPPQIIALATPSPTALSQTEPSQPNKTHSPKERAAFAKLYRKAENFLNTGEIAAARLIFEHLATAGDARSALALARTYESATLQRHGIFTVKEDPEQAQYWYEQAAERGNAEARRILASAARK